MHSRLRSIGIGRRLLDRPELAAVIELFCTWLVFAVLAGNRGFLSLAAAANYLEVAAQVGIVSTAVTLLMIAGEFDLSVGSVVGFTSVIAAMLIGNLGLPIPLVIVLVIALGMFIGFINGVMVVKTGLPSFLVTLGGLFVYRGAAIGTTIAVAGTPVLGGFAQRVAADPISRLFTAQLPGGIHASVVWWLILAAVGTYVLGFTTFGNWIFGTGGRCAARARWACRRRASESICSWRLAPRPHSCRS